MSYQEIVDELKTINNQFRIMNNLLSEIMLSLKELTKIVNE